MDQFYRIISWFYSIFTVWADEAEDSLIICVDNISNQDKAAADWIQRDADDSVELLKQFVNLSILSNQSPIWVYDHKQSENDILFQWLCFKNISYKRLLVYYRFSKA